MSDDEWSLDDEIDRASYSALIGAGDARPQGIVQANDVPVMPCRGCGVPKRIDTECVATAECIEQRRIWRQELDQRMRAGNPDKDGEK